MRWLPLLLLVATGCGVVLPDNPAGTLAAENRTFVTEAAEIRGTLGARETEVLATSIAAETLVAEENLRNSVLLATVRAGDPPTVQVVAQLDRSVGNLGGGTIPEVIAEGPGGEVVSTYTSTDVRPEDGCGIDRTNSFEAGTVRVFAVQEVASIPANTLVGIEWFYAGALALEDQLLVTESAETLCVWFFVEPYSTGNWSLQFTSNGVQVGNRVNFTVME